ncbi:proteasome endopeptidase complex, beta subunit [Purpureocillium lavendulum]|uniref:Proteasome endopeptidase complex, beta subunit n=1 Tax=Purpureocillium lavendulum TaxID=1247861 RepID=A0AB34G2P8_9HYPO|nr:proteasome endopeptidase complex, beta subunit [Purpureocillium lavendulum]
MAALALSLSSFSCAPDASASSLAMSWKGFFSASLMAFHSVLMARNVSWADEPEAAALAPLKRDLTKSVVSGSRLGPLSSAIFLSSLISAFSFSSGVRTFLAFFLGFLGTAFLAVLVVAFFFFVLVPDAAFLVPEPEPAPADDAAGERAHTVADRQRTGRAAPWNEGRPATCGASLAAAASLDGAEAITRPAAAARPIDVNISLFTLGRLYRPRDDVYGSYDASHMQSNNGPIQATQQPIVTGTSVIAIKFNDGVVIAADNLASYGSLARFTDVKRLRPFADSSVVGFSGDVSDMQYLDRHLTDLALTEAYADTSADAASHPRLNAANLHRYLSKLLYRRRSKFDPLWNHVLVAGLDDAGAPFLAAADLLGSTYSAPSLATGFGAMLAQPIMRKHVPDEESAKKLSREEAIEIIKECMKVLFYRDARSLDKYSIAVVTKEGVDLKTNEELEKQSWAFADRIKGYGTQTV